MNPEIFINQQNMRPPRRQHSHISPTTVIIAFTLLVFCTVSVVTRIPNVNPKNEWDMLIFTQNWPNAVCLGWQDKSKQNQCDLPSDKKKWTIHGLWPTKFGTKGPWFCDNTYPFNEEEIYGLLPRLEKEWTPVEIHKNKDTFWKHEWEKHGTCAAILPSLSSELKFFSKTLELGEKYNMEEILNKIGIVPRKEGYDPQVIWSSVQSSLGKKPFLMCYSEPKTGLSFLQEIRICFNKNLELVDCDSSQPGLKPGKDVTLIECPKHKPTFYMTEIPKDLLELVKYEHPLVTGLKVIKLLQWMTL